MVTLLSAAVVAFAVFLALEQYPHDVPRQPPRPRAPPPLAGVWQVNDELGRTGQFIAKGKIISAETVFLKDSSDCSTLYATDSRGRVWYLPPPERENEDPQIVASVGGTLLGGAFDKHGGMYLADSMRGLLYIPPNSSSPHDAAPRIVSSLAPSDLLNAVTEEALDRHEIRFANDIAIDHESGNVYFTDATRIAPARSTDRHEGGTFISFGTSHLAGEASGRVLCYVPSTGETHVLATGIRFANGVALSKDRTHLIVVATSSYVLYKVPLTGVQTPMSMSSKPIPASELELFYPETLPGFPDGLTVASDGSVWVPLFAPVPGIARFADIAPAFIRHILVRIPHRFRPTADAVHSVIAVISADGQLMRTLHDKQKRFGLLTSVERCGPYLFCGSLKGRHAARFTVSED